MRKSWKRFTDSTKKFWNTYLRPKVEPALKIFVIRKVTKEVDRWQDK